MPSREKSFAWMIGLLLMAVGSANAHPPPALATRELVRVQGHRTKATVAAAKRHLILNALGVEQPFEATDWQTFSLADTPPAAELPPPAKPQLFMLQGSREMLARFAAARPEQTVTLLAEHRPGSADLFVLTLDLCPP